MLICELFAVFLQRDYEFGLREKVMKRLLRGGLVVLIASLLAACATPQIDSPWKPRSYQTWPPSNYGNCGKVYS